MKRQNLNQMTQPIGEKQNVLSNPAGSGGGGGTALTIRDNSGAGGLTVAGTLVTLPVAVQSSAMVFRNGQLLGLTLNYTVSGDTITIAGLLSTDYVAVIQ
jgi:hypothetical protein